MSQRLCRIGHHHPQGLITNGQPCNPYHRPEVGFICSEVCILNINPIPPRENDPLVTIDISWLSDTLGYHYVDLAGARIREKLSGEDSVNFVLDSGADQFVAKWYSNVDMRMLGEELAAMRWLATRGVSVPAVVVTRDGTDFAEVAGGCLVLLHFIAGDVLGDDFSCALQIAAFLADFHQQSTAFTGPFCSDRSEFARLAAFKSSCADDGAIVHVDGIQRFISDYENEVALFRATQHDVHGNAECGIIHHDLHSGNFLVDAEDGASHHNTYGCTSTCRSAGRADRHGNTG